MEQVGEGEVLTAFYGALNAVEDIAKSETADTGKFTYSFAPLPAVLDEVKRACEMFKLAVTQYMTVHEGLFAVVTVLIHADGSTVRFPPTCLPMPRDAQPLGSAATYLRRYSLLSIFGIATEDDDGASATKANRTQEQHAGARSAAEARIRQELGALHPDFGRQVKEEFRQEFGATLMDLPVSKHGDALGWVLSRLSADEGAGSDNATAS